MRCIHPSSVVKAGLPLADRGSSAYLGGVVADHVTISHGGHGINSYALTWRMAYGPLAMVVQDGWGGVYMGSAANGRLAELFDRVGQLITIADARIEECCAREDEKWVRPVRLVVSPMRRMITSDVWNPRTGCRDNVVLGSEPWKAITRQVSECSIAMP